MLAELAAATVGGGEVIVALLAAITMGAVWVAVCVTVVTATVALTTGTVVATTGAGTHVFAVSRSLRLPV